MAQIIDTTIRNTLVNIVREAPWGPSRQALEAKADALRAEADAELGRGYNFARSDAFRWQADIHQFAAAVRFPREGDDQVEKMAGHVKEEIRAIVAGKTGRMNAARSESIKTALQKALAEMSAEEVRTLQIVIASEIVDERAEAARVHDMIDSGADRPSDITEERWNAALQSYSHQMTLENTPDEFLYPDRDDGADFDWSAYVEEEEEPEPEQAPTRSRVQITGRVSKAEKGGYSM